MPRTAYRRQNQTLTVTRIDGTGIEGKGAGSDVTGFGVPAAVAAVLAVGDVIDLETSNNWITGVRRDGIWLFRLTDEGLDQKHREVVDQINAEAQRTVDANRENWTTRTEALPGWLHPRFDTFRERGGSNFERQGWHYELVVAELAALVHDHYGDDLHATPAPPQVAAYLEREHPTVNQVEFAHALVAAHRQGKHLANTVSAMAPITGKVSYELGD